MNWPAAVLALKTVVQFPVLLPQHVPAYAHESRIYAIAEEKRADYYAVDFAFTPNCAGEHACSFAHVIGSKRPLRVGFVPSTCAAYCSDARLTWKQGNAYYEITLNTGRLEDLRLMQRSMQAIK